MPTLVCGHSRSLSLAAAFRISRARAHRPAATSAQATRVVARLRLAAVVRVRARTDRRHLLFAAVVLFRQARLDARRDRRLVEEADVVLLREANLRARKWREGMAL